MLQIGPSPSDPICEKGLLSRRKQLAPFLVSKSKLNCQRFDYVSKSMLIVIARYLERREHQCLVVRNAHANAYSGARQHNAVRATTVLIKRRLDLKSGICSL